MSDMYSTTCPLCGSDQVVAYVTQVIEVGVAKTDRWGMDFTFFPMVPVDAAGYEILEDEPFRCADCDARWSEDDREYAAKDYHRYWWEEPHTPTDSQPEPSEAP